MSRFGLNDMGKGVRRITTILQYIRDKAALYRRFLHSNVENEGVCRKNGGGERERNRKRVVV